MLTYRKSEGLEIIGYSDSDFAGCQESKHSTSRYIYILWPASRHPTMGYGCETVTSLQEVDGIERSLKIYCDNNSTVLYSNNNRSSTKSKFIDIKFLVVKERVQNKQIFIKHIGTSFMVADPLTKGLIPKLFHEHTTYGYYSLRYLSSMGICMERIERMTKANILPSLNFDDLVTCVNCIGGATRSLDLFEIIHTNISDPLIPTICDNNVVKYLIVTDLMKDGSIMVEHIDTDSMMVDSLTNGLKHVFKRHVENMG
ncbi:Copia protein, partial [Mucuna pruriens]